MLPTWNFDPEASYLVAGGFGGLGRSTARWMASRNAKNLILLGRKGAHSIAAKQLLEDLTLLGVTVAMPSCDVTNRNSLADVLAECDRTMPPIKGCIVGMMILKVASLIQPTVTSTILTKTGVGLPFGNHGILRLSNPNRPKSCWRSQPTHAPSS